MPDKSNLWLGSQTSYESSLEARLKAEAYAMTADAKGDYPPLLSVQDGVGVITINGDLVTGYAGWELRYGNVGYGDIRDALSAAVADAEIKSIVLNISSGGGAAEGVLETAQLIQRIDKVKPVYTYSGGDMMSAALWLGVSARKVYASETAMVGSLGVLMVHVEKSKMLAENGIAVKVIRAGESKALANPYEPLTAKAEAEMQTLADGLYKIFMGFVADARGTTYAAGDTAFGQGVVFLGAPAKNVGLVDFVGSFEDAFAAASKVVTKAQASAKSNQQFYGATNNGSVQAPVVTLPVSASASTETMQDNPTNPKGNDMTKSLTQEQLAAMAAGVDIEVLASADVETEEEKAAEVAALAAVEAQATADAALAAKAAAPDALVVLQSMLTTAQEQVVVSKMEAKAATEALAAAQAQAESFVAIARASVTQMGIALSQKADASALTPAQVLAEHTRLSGVFKEKFKVGGVAATTQEEKPEAKASVNPLFAAVLSSTNAK